MSASPRSPLTVVPAFESSPPDSRPRPALNHGLARHLGALCKLSTVANSEPESSLMLATALEVCVESLSADGGSVMLAGGSPPHALSMVASRGLRVRPDGEAPLIGGVAAWVAENMLPLHLVGPLERYPQFRGLRSNPDIAEAMVAPIVFRREVLGTIAVSASRPDTFAPELLSFLVNVADIVAAAISRNRAERAREHQDRLAVLGQLSASMAHELNNPLTFLRSNLHSLRALFPKGEREVTLAPSDQAEISSVVEETLQGVEQMVALVANLKTVARKPANRLQTLEVKPLLVRAETMVRPQFRHEVTFRIEAAETPVVSVDQSRILQVLINLLVNAAQAAGEGGNVTLTCEEDHGTVAIQIHDDGPGIPPDVAPRLFEPFFTTKLEGEGTGLGLSISRQICRDHGGDLTFTSEVGHGSCFTVTLPGVE